MATHASPKKMSLNLQQQAAVDYLDGPCLVLAGAGSGKTGVITQKIAHLINNCGYEPKHILAVTFTNKASKEMSERVTKIMSGSSANLKGLTISTFHSFGVRFLRDEAKHLGLKEKFSILDQDDCFSILQELCATTDKALIKTMQSTISLWKNGQTTPEQALKEAKDEQELQFARVYANYNATISAYQAVDFDDLIRLPVELLQSNEEVRNRWQAKLRYILVDEYQDTNSCQYALLKLLTGVRGMFTAVGDDDQAIYAWRGATLDNLKLLQTDFHRLKVIKLEQNYRSTERILNAANAVIAHNPKLFDKKLWSEYGQGDPIRVIPMANEEEEAENVVMRLQAHKIANNAQFSDYAILYRGNHQARVFEQALRKERIPYVMSGGQSFFERAEIRDIMAYFRLLNNINDDPAFIRAVTTPKRGIGAATLEHLGQYAGRRSIPLFEAVFEAGFASVSTARQLEPLLEFVEFINTFEERAAKDEAPEVLDDFIKAIGYEQYLYEHFDERQAQNKWQNVNEFVAWMKRRAEEDDKKLSEVIQSMVLISMLDKGNAEENTVRLSTLHASKGLEYPHVFLVGVEEGLLPHISRDEALEDPTRIEEERRLMYVGITRARKSLHITWCQKRRRGRDFENREVSRFVKEMKHESDAARENLKDVPQVTPKQRIEVLKAMLAKQAGQQDLPFKPTEESVND
ncbi:ATP-dependent DNA helicase Rep [Formosimonas limnophila]|uniref:ATP-dependent DNA helicase Rep n=1 Tax=Formosimonas limnophila TaxID=1384487 RepID=A0A8J3G0E9_9BURK|nr:UvrD-helicase domain-containing protein [Formosimonas limnophila]GHA78517.1 ATP-dependent DNA helicase Rep [Formosimonas limnophila]